MSDFSLASALGGAVLGAFLAISLIVLSDDSANRDKERVQAGVFTYEGKAFLLLPIRNPASALPPAG